MDCREAQLQTHWQATAHAEQEEARLAHVDSCVACQGVLDGLQQLDKMVETGPLTTLETGIGPLPSAEASFARLQARLQQRSASEEHSISKDDTQKPWWESLNQWLDRSLWWMAPAAVALFVFVPWMTQPESFSPEKFRVNKPSMISPKRAVPSQWTAKGSPIFDMLYAHPAQNKYRHSAPKRAIQGSVTPLHPGDFVQFQYKLPYNAHVMIVGLNEKGELFVYSPFQGKKSLLVKVGLGKLPAAGALELDDTLGVEHFFVMISKNSFSIEQLKKQFGTRLESLRKLRKKFARATLRVGDWWIKTLSIQKHPHRKNPPRP